MAALPPDDLDEQPTLEWSVAGRRQTGGWCVLSEVRRAVGGQRRVLWGAWRQSRWLSLCCDARRERAGRTRG